MKRAIFLLLLVAGCSSDHNGFGPYPTKPTVVPADSAADSTAHHHHHHR